MQALGLASLTQRHDLKVTHVTACESVSVPSFSMPLCACASVFASSLADGQLGCFQSGAMMNKIVLNVYKQVSPFF